MLLFASKKLTPKSHYSSSLLVDIYLQKNEKTKTEKAVWVNTTLALSLRMMFICGLCEFYKHQDSREATIFGVRQFSTCLLFSNTNNTCINHFI